jgi:hypothetical protein
LKNFLKKSGKKHIIIILLILIVTLWGFNRSLQQSNLKLKEDQGIRIYHTLIQLNQQAYIMSHRLDQYRGDNLTDEIIDLWTLETYYKKFTCDNQSLHGLSYYYDTMGYGISQYLTEEQRDKEKLSSTLKMANHDLMELIELILEYYRQNSLPYSRIGDKDKELNRQITEYINNSRAKYINR